jgi:hypothetical protein
MKVVVLLIWPLFFLISFFLFKKAKLSVFSNTYSDLGSHSIFGHFFNTLLIVAGVIQLVFLISVLLLLLHVYNTIAILGLSCLIVTTLAGVFTGIITEVNNKTLHKNLAIIGFSFSIIGYILFGIYFLSSNLAVGAFMLCWGFVVMPYQAFRHLSGHKLYAKNEFFIFLGAFLTNIALVVLYC